MKAKLFLCILSALVVAVIVTIGFGMIPMETVVEKTALVVLISAWAVVFGAVVAKRYPLEYIYVGIFATMAILFPYCWGFVGLPVQLLLGCSFSVILISCFYLLKSKLFKDETLGGKLVVVGGLGMIAYMAGITIIRWLFKFFWEIELPRWLLDYGVWTLAGVFFIGLIKRYKELMKDQEEKNSTTHTK